MSASTAAAHPSVFDKPRPAEVDVHGLTHAGRVRQGNADHFIVASFHRAMRVHATSLDVRGLPPEAEFSRGYLFLVADGVSSLAHAEDGSARATDVIARSLLEMHEVPHPSDPHAEREIEERLCTFVKEAHEALVAFGEEVGGAAATTITAMLTLWPRAFIAHAGDSRAYRLRDGRLERLTTDQTMAQVMVDAGALAPEAAETSKLKNVLVSALGSNSVDIQVFSTDMLRTDRWLLCTDGLTRHVSDAELREQLSSAEPARTVCERLFDLAMERGGEDNVTIVVGGVKETER